MVYEAGENNIVLYADNGRISGHNSLWVQATLMEAVRMFERVGLQTNLVKTNEMVCTPGLIWGEMGVLAYKRRARVEGPCSGIGRKSG